MNICIYFKCCSATFVDNVYFDNLFGIYSYRILILTQDIISVDGFILLVYSLGQKKYKSFQGALAGPMEVSDCHLAPCSQMLPHHLSQQGCDYFNMGLHKHEIFSDVESRGGKNVLGCLYHICQRLL